MNFIDQYFFASGLPAQQLFCLTVLSAAVVPMNANEVTLVIKSPHHEDAPLRFNISLEGTVRDIKERLSQHHPEHPHPKDQRLIFAGKLLTDSSRTVDVLKQVRARAPHAATACQGAARC